MTILLVVWSQMVTIGAALAMWRVLSQQTAHAEAQTAVWAERLAKVRPVPAVVVPAPDLGPYLDRLANMATNMVREAVGAVTTVVNGPVQPERVTATAEDVLSQYAADNGSFDENGESIPVWIPPWEEDGWVEPSTTETVDVSLNGM